MALIAMNARTRNDKLKDMTERISLSNASDTWFRLRLYCSDGGHTAKCDISPSRATAGLPKGRCKSFGN
jgi:hypothetical protein